MRPTQCSVLFAWLSGMLCGAAAWGLDAPATAPASAPAASPAGEAPPVNTARLMEQAELRAEIEDWDIGRLWQGEVRKREIKITNVGPVPVKVTQFRSPCACTQAKLEKREYAPGESGTLEIVFVTMRTNDKYPK